MQYRRGVLIVCIYSYSYLANTWLSTNTGLVKWSIGLILKFDFKIIPTILRVCAITIIIFSASNIVTLLVSNQ